MARKREKRQVTIGPFGKGLNTFSDPSSIPDDALAELLNMELDLDGSLVSRPPFHDTEILLELPAMGELNLLGFYYTPEGVEYLIASNGNSSTYFLSGNEWHLLTDTFSATAMVQFDDKAWLLAPVGWANPGGTWTPGGGFVAEPDMPKGTIIVAWKFRLWIAQGEQATTNGSRLYVSKVLGVTPFWPSSPDFVDIARGDGQYIVGIRRYYESLLIFRTASIYRFQYTMDPAAGVIEVSVPNIGLDTRESLAEHENYFYFMYDDRAYEYMNGRAYEISQAIKFETSTMSGHVSPRSVSVFQDRAIFAYYGTLFVFNLVTRTWSKWQAPSTGGISKVLERRGTEGAYPQAFVMPSSRPPIQQYSNEYVNPSFESDSALPEGTSRSTEWAVRGTHSLFVPYIGGWPYEYLYPSEELYPINVYYPYDNQFPVGTMYPSNDFIPVNV